MSAQVIQFPSKRRANGLSTTEASEALGAIYAIVERGVSSGAELAHTEDGDAYVEIFDNDDDEPEAKWLAFKEDGLYLLITPGRRAPLVSSPHFEALIAGIRAIAG